MGILILILCMILFCKVVELLFHVAGKLLGVVFSLLGYIIDRYASENGNPNQKTISLGAVRRLCKEPCGYLALKDAVDTAISESDQHYINEGMQ